MSVHHLEAVSRIMQMSTLMALGTHIFREREKSRNADIDCEAVRTSDSFLSKVYVSSVSWKSLETMTTQGRESL